ncbi:MAG: glutathione peroxidase [Flavobacteriales bacterium]|jgi:glutathione peroxidase|tara:strand:+ start:15255 stop:15740 length:486 start_codon:yes stop_codon:yes gene_type:complete
MNFYKLEANKPNGEKVSMDTYKGKTILLVNTATKCGLTPQFKGLEELHKTYAERGLVVLGFPCNQFLGQEPLNNKDMEENCLINHGVTFQLMEKIDVNGSKTHPIYKFLKNKLRSGIFSNRIKWNFEKFLIDSTGKPIKRFSPKTKPQSMEGEIIKALKNV